MRFATIRTAAGTSAARLDSGAHLLIPLDAADVAELLHRRPRRGSRPAGRVTRAGCGGRLRPVVTNPSKIICVGLNYRTHIKETGRELPGYPTLFAKFAETLKGPNDDLGKSGNTGMPPTGTGTVPANPSPPVPSRTRPRRTPTPKYLNPMALRRAAPTHAPQLRRRNSVHAPTALPGESRRALSAYAGTLRRPYRYGRNGYTHTRSRIFRHTMPVSECSR